MRNQILFGAFALMLIAGTSRADSLGALMNVSATVVPNCRLEVPPLSFGTYDPLSANAVQPADASTTVIVNCTRNTVGNLSFDYGRNSASIGARAMGGPGVERLGYQIFRDPARSQLWATGVDAVRFTSDGISKPQQMTVFGRIAASQEVAPGSYTDVLTATVDF
jgi:spore coat protein U domain-containing protein, fimbrial subunit CupE1/2/3/6